MEGNFRLLSDKELKKRREDNEFQLKKFCMRNMKILRGMLVFKDYQK